MVKRRHVQLSPALEAQLATLATPIRQLALDYEPASLDWQEWRTLRPLLLEVVALVAPKTEPTFRVLLSASVSFLHWSYLNGFSSDLRDIFVAERVDLWKHQLLSKTKKRNEQATRLEYVSRMRAVGRRINPASNWPTLNQGVRGGARGLRPPYSDKELLAYEEAIASMEPSPERDLYINLFAMTLGAGVTASELPMITGAHIQIQEDLAWLNIPGRHSRRVPVVDTYMETFSELQQLHGDDAILKTKSGKNYLNQAIKKVSLGREIEPVNVMRLRTTWMTHRLRAGLNPKVLLLTYAGLRTTNVMVDLALYLPETSESVNCELARKSVR